jgi:hypothetical protein
VTTVFDLETKKTHFPVFAKNFHRPWMKLKIFFANFQILGPLGCQGWVVIPQNVKKVKITAPYSIFVYGANAGQRVMKPCSSGKKILKLIFLRNGKI